jgi:sensor c-di-GMP phosphodiesterase-like protein
MITRDDVAAGLSAGEFFLEYLPTVSLESGRCVGGEALARWRRGGVVVPPGEFIPVIEETPVAGLLTYWVMEAIVADLADWLRAHPYRHLSFNVPPAILGRGGLPYAGQKSGLYDFRSQIVMEVTERGIPDRLGLEGLQFANEMGVRVALDDVTLTGANLAILTRCPFEIIKLDRSLTDQITPNGPRPEWLAGVKELLRTTKLEVIAEGVERKDQADALRAAGIGLAQGFYFSRPLPAETFVAFEPKG